ncbi:hypothetical protein NIES4073_77870 [Kalymmatonema gypsitolerans NIES-4073]|nr:hypothetical protein NIES4073_77870 [Scytonema sp. NIES-4073]
MADCFGIIKSSKSNVKRLHKDSASHLDEGDWGLGIGDWVLTLINYGAGFNPPRNFDSQYPIPS